MAMRTAVCAALRRRSIAIARRSNSLVAGWAARRRQHRRGKDIEVARLAERTGDPAQFVRRRAPRPFWHERCQSYRASHANGAPKPAFDGCPRHRPCAPPARCVRVGRGRHNRRAAAPTGPPAMAPASVRRNVPISPGRRCQRRERSRDRPQLQITAEVHSTTL
jgi:hypothetical protein